jgi:ubiquinone biosynthesis protein
MARQSTLGGRRPGTAARRGEVERRLAAGGRAGRFPRRWGAPTAGPVAAVPGPATTPGAAADEPAVLRLRAALADLGPLFSAFGLYLSSRPDLLSETDCQLLAALPGHRPPMPTAALHRLLARELGRPPEEAFAAFDPQPGATTLVHQEHRALLHGGQPVMVRLVRDDLEAVLDRDLALLPLAARALADHCHAAGGAAAAGAAVEQFAAAVRAAADLGRQAAALDAFGQDAAASGLDLCAPRVIAPLSAARLLTREEPDGAALEQLVQAAPAAAGWEGAAAGLAVRLCQAFLRQALAGRPFPAELRAADLRVLDGGRIAWTGGAVAALPGDATAALWEYLVAAAAHDPARASAALLREMEGGPSGRTAATGGGLDERLRQLVPFRDGGWGATDDLAGFLFLHWRSAAGLGYRARPHLVLFYRGLAATAWEARRLAPGRDPLRDGLEGARLAAGLGGLAGALSPAQLQQVLAGYAAAMLAAPQRLNDLLTMAAEGRVSIKLEMVEPPAERRRQDLAAASLAAVLALGAIVLLARHLAATGVLGPWGERIGALLLAVAGGWLLRGRGARA